MTLPTTGRAPYRLASYRFGREARAGAVIGQAIFAIAALVGDPSYVSVADVLADWDRAHPLIDAAAAAPHGDGTPVAEVELLAPVPRPGAIYCVGSNYRDHSEEMRVAGGRPSTPDPRTLGLDPFFFIKSSHAITGPGSTVRVSDYCQEPDWEIELVAVIGRTARHLTPANALSCVAGYTIGNDLSARDLRARDQLPTTSLFRADWFRHKSFDGSAPMGPWITPAAYIDDPTTLTLQLWVNDDLKQSSDSGKMIYTAAEQIAYLSSGITLHPGDLIMTGTPAGVGAGRDETLRVGDTVAMEISQIGRMAFSIA